MFYKIEILFHSEEDYYSLGFCSMPKAVQKVRMGPKLHSYVLTSSMKQLLLTIVDLQIERLKILFVVATLEFQ